MAPLVHRAAIIIHSKNYKYTSIDAINACVTASFILSLVEVG